MDDFQDLSMITCASSNDKVSGILTDLSPMRDSAKGGRYYNGEITDDKTSESVWI